MEEPLCEDRVSAFFVVLLDDYFIGAAYCSHGADSFTVCAVTLCAVATLLSFYKGDDIID
jgi:hypothetical protein